MDAYIEIFTGKVGGGKTYSSVIRIIGHLANGGSLYSNVEINFENTKQYIADKHNLLIEESQVNYLEADQIAQCHKHIKGGTLDTPVLLIIDEAHLWFNALDHKEANRDFLTYLTQTRKVHIHVIFITQHAANINAQFRRQAQYTWKFSDMQKMVICGIRWPFKQIRCCQMDEDGKTIVDRYTIPKDPEIFRCYTSTALLKPLAFDTKTSLGKRKLQAVQPPENRFKLERVIEQLHFTPLRVAVMLLILIGIRYTL